MTERVYENGEDAEKDFNANDYVGIVYKGVMLYPPKFVFGINFVMFETAPDWRETVSYKDGLQSLKWITRFGTCVPFGINLEKEVSVGPYDIERVEPFKGDFVLFSKDKRFYKRYGAPFWVLATDDGESPLIDFEAEEAAYQEYVKESRKTKCSFCGDTSVVLGNVPLGNIRALGPLDPCYSYNYCNTCVTEGKLDAHATSISRVLAGKHGPRPVTLEAKEQPKRIFRYTDTCGNRRLVDGFMTALVNNFPVNLKAEDDKRYLAWVEAWGVYDPKEEKK